MTMSNDNNESKNESAVSEFCVLLTIAFIVLKLCGVIDWSWIWVLSPLWLPLATVIVICLLIFIIALIVNR